MLIEAGDELTVYYNMTDIEKIREISKWYFKGEEPAEEPEENTENTENNENNENDNGGQ